ncbi:hypothetical protein EDD90_1616 [Streptomyces sp. Ag109_O5-1]|nr:hypothetical protein EDD90_1616 [Streptomyces sp. Ag109_O5-1]
MVRACTLGVGILSDEPRRELTAALPGQAAAPGPAFVVNQAATGSRLQHRRQELNEPSETGSSTLYW